MFDDGDPMADLSAAMDAIEAAGVIPNTLVMHPRFLAAMAARTEATSRREARHKHRIGNKLARRCAARLGWR